MLKDFPSLVNSKFICIYENYIEIDQPKCFKASQLKSATSAEEPTSYKVEVSTDTTAIKSFDNSTMIAVFLAILATVFALWLAKKSFELTKRSFEVVLDQIKSSLEISKNETKQVLESNNLLVSSQLKGIVTGNVMNSRQNWINDVRENSIDLIYLVDKYCSLRIETANYFKLYRDSDSSELNLNKKEKQADIDKCYRDVLKKIITITFYLNPEDKIDIEVTVELKNIKEKVEALHKIIINPPDSQVSDSFISHADEINSYRTSFKEKMQDLLKNEWEKVKEGK